MQIKITVSDRYVTPSTAAIKNTHCQVVTMWTPWKSHTLLVGGQKGTSVLENWHFHSVQHTPIIPPSCPVPGCVSERKVSVQRLVCECL